MLDPSDVHNWRAWVCPLDLDRPLDSTQDFRMVDQGRQCVLNGDIAGARAGFEQARKWGTPEVRAEALVRLGDLDRESNPESSRAFYEQARLLCGAGSHNLAIVRHRLATLHEEQKRCGEAWSEYTASRAIWVALAKRHGQLGNRNRFRRYSEHLRVLTTHIDEIAAHLATRNAEPQPAGAAPKRRVRKPRTVKPSSSTEGKPRTRRRKPANAIPGTWIAAIPIYADLAAGSGLWIGDDDEIQSFAEMGYLQIDGKRYELTSVLGDGSGIRLSRSYWYGMSQVHGNSMNLRGIDDGDYVLYRKPGDSRYCPDEGDLVAASVESRAGRLGVVKRYHLPDGGLPVLQSQSTEDHPDIRLDEYRVDPVGQVIAVLKPVR